MPRNDDIDPRLLALLMEWLVDQATSGSPSIGGDWPYDDYDLQDTIGGIGATPPAYDIGLIDDGTISGLTTAPAMYDTSPSTYGGPPPSISPIVRQTRPVSPFVDQALGQLQYGLNQRTANRPAPVPTPVAAPTPEPRPVVGTPAPKREKEKVVRPRTAPAPQPAQARPQQSPAFVSRSTPPPPAQAAVRYTPPPPAVARFTPAPVGTMAQHAIGRAANVARSRNRR